MARNLTVVAPEAFAATAAASIARAVRDAADRGPVTLALSGGRGPVTVYRQLASLADIPWDRVDVYFADERAVPPNDDQSNYRLVQETLGAIFTGRPGAVHRMEADDPDLEAAAARYEARLPSSLDILVLGLGEDGHTASLYPGHPASAEERRRVLAVEGPAVPPRRITITPPVILSARATLMLVAGAGKAAAVARALAGPYDPVSCPGQWARAGQWMLDEPAAVRIRTAAS